jgi:hypothetical protein
VTLLKVHQAIQFGAMIGGHGVRLGGRHDLRGAGMAQRRFVPRRPAEPHQSAAGQTGWSRARDKQSAGRLQAVQRRRENRHGSRWPGRGPLRSAKIA